MKISFCHGMFQVLGVDHELQLRKYKTEICWAGFWFVLAFRNLA